MADKKRKNRGLGRGLSALMADVSAPEPNRPDSSAPAPTNAVPIESIRPNKDQPRLDFEDEELQSLAASIEAKGILQPLIVRPIDGAKEQYELVAGERRWRAAQMAQLHEVPVIVRDLDDVEILEIAIVENIQRADLNPIEEGLGYQQLIDRFGHTQEQLSQALGKSRSHIANSMRLLSLPDDVQQMLRGKSLSAGHARALITADDPSGLARIVVKQGLSVRDTEKLAAKPKAPKKSAPRPPQKDADTRALENDLSANLRMKVRIDHSGKGESGQVTVQYQDLDELDALCRMLSASR